MMVDVEGKRRKGKLMWSWTESVNIDWMEKGLSGGDANRIVSHRIASELMRTLDCSTQIAIIRLDTTVQQRTTSVD